MTQAAHSEDLPGLIDLHIGCRLEYAAESETHAIALVEPHSSVQGTIAAERWDPQPPPVRFRDLYGNVCRRIELGPEMASFSYDATVRISPEPEAMPGAEEEQHRIEDLPPELLHWLLPSRLCESDMLADTAWELFGETPRGAGRLAALCDWIHENVEYGVESLPTTPVTEILERRGGVCRDFAHLGTSFSRALGIPARYVCGYLPDIGIPGPYPLMDFHAWFEVWLGERWWTYDARYNEPRIGRVPIGHGRDAVDVALVTTYGDATLERMTVWADAVSDEPATTGAGVSHGR
ncbi:MAG TPA: transglutaminase family protein [Gaiellales bacterium]|jgi:transglutaminase-like putative cysteine protease|nr:transglutaminase family protein [Gaiellales bacterium]